MSYTVHLKPGGYIFEVSPQETVLAAAVRHGLALSHECRGGSCSACKAQLLEGQVHYDEQVLALSEDEREAGFALLCTAKPTSDLIIHVEGFSLPPQIVQKKLRYHVSHIQLLNDDIYRVILNPPSAAESLIYHAGQYLEILHRDSSPRPFSIANALNANGQLELHIRYLPDNPFIIELLDEIKTTKRLKVIGPYGNSYYRADPPLPMILIAGGTGFAPIKAIIEQAEQNKFAQPIYFYWGARSYKHLYLHELALQWSTRLPIFHYIPVLSASPPSEKWKGRTGLVHEAVLKDHTDFTNHRVYASGPPEMVYAAVRAFQGHGLNKALMYSDWFDYEAK